MANTFRLTIDELDALSAHRDATGIKSLHAAVQELVMLSRECGNLSFLEVNMKNGTIGRTMQTAKAVIIMVPDGKGKWKNALTVGIDDFRESYVFVNGKLFDKSLFDKIPDNAVLLS